MKYPNVRQDGFRNCGPCSLASIIRYYKGYVSVDALEDMMHTNLSGTRAYDLVMAARKIGFSAYGMKVDKLDNLKLPLIAHVTISSYNHFVVIYKVSNKVLIADPADKLKYMDIKDFYKIWNNIVIILKPLKKLPYTKPLRLHNYINKFLNKYAFKIICLIFLSIIVSFISIIYSLFIQYLINNFDKKLIILFFTLCLIKNVLIWYKNKLSIDLNKKIHLDLVMDISKKIISLPYRYYKNHKVGEVVSRFNDSSIIVEYINNFILSIIYIPMTIIFLIFMIKVSHILFMIVMLILFMYILIAVIINSYLERKIKVYQNEKASYSSSLIGSLNAYETIKGINIETDVIDKLNNNFLNFRNTTCSVEKNLSIRDVTLSFILNVGFLLIIIYGFKYLSIGKAISFYMIYSYLLEPLEVNVNLFTSYKNASNASRRIQELFYNFTSHKIVAGQIEYKDITFKYDNKNILTNFNLKIAKGEKILIKGASASGKSTLLKLLKGYYKSNVYVSGTKIEDKIDNIIYLNDNKTFFSDTLKDNLMCDNNNLISEILDVCLIDKDLNMIIDEDGFNLNGGEKSKISLARALLRKFDILLIDEILDEIDYVQERQIIMNMFARYKNKTIIVISHRSNNQDLYDRVITLKKGGLMCGE